MLMRYIEDHTSFNVKRRWRLSFDVNSNIKLAISSVKPNAKLAIYHKEYGVGKEPHRHMGTDMVIASGRVES